MHFDEYKRKGSSGWLDYRRKQELVDNFKVVLGCIALVVLYAVAGTLE